MHELGDFTTGRRVIVITAIAIGIGFVSAYVAKALFSPDRLEQVWQSAVAAH